MIAAVLTSPGTIEVQGRPFPIAELVSEEIPLSEAPRAIERARDLSKVLIQCAR